MVWLGESYGLIVVNDKVPAQSFPELIKLAKAQPGKIAVAVPGLGTNYPKSVSSAVGADRF